MFRCISGITALVIIIETTKTANTALSELWQKRRCWSSGNGQSARWFNHGERINRGSFLFDFLMKVMSRINFNYPFLGAKIMLFFQIFINYLKS